MNDSTAVDAATRQEALPGALAGRPPEDEPGADSAVLRRAEAGLQPGGRVVVVEMPSAIWPTQPVPSTHRLNVLV